MKLSFWQFFRELPWWYHAWVAFLVLLVLFTGAEDFWNHLTGHPFWPVTP